MKIKMHENIIASKKFTKFIEDYRNDINIDEIMKYGLNNITSSFFNKGVLRGLRNIIIFLPSLFGLCCTSDCSSNSFAIFKRSVSVSSCINEGSG